MDVSVLDLSSKCIQDLHAQEHLVRNLVRMVILMKCLKPTGFLFDRKCV